MKVLVAQFIMFQNHPTPRVNKQELRDQISPLSLNDCPARVAVSRGLVAPGIRAILFVDSTADSTQRPFNAPHSGGNASMLSCD
jgi:hypothetical protein